MGHKINNVPLISKIWDIIFLFFGQITFWDIFRDTLRGPRLFCDGPLKKSPKMAHEVICLKKKFISCIFKISGTLLVSIFVS
jgi:hypothetical protein